MPAEDHGKDQATYSVRIPTVLRDKVTDCAKRSRKSHRKYVADAIASAVESAEEAPVNARIARVATRLEHLFALVRSIEDDEQARRRAERAHFVEAVAQSYTPMAEAVTGNSAVVEALAAEVRAVGGVVSGLLDRMHQQDLILAALLSAAEAKGARRAYAEIIHGIAKSGRKTNDYLAAAANRGAKGE
ncbi:hypothetical protein GALL_531140 [mine drainage metagenome]|uniref:Uncharacterized protein n=1 Tax=mine drainage metagenome TaxID=410659 RepID=A0A1J5P2P7_9ZZZZ